MKDNYLSLIYAFSEAIILFGINYYLYSHPENKDLAQIFLCLSIVVVISRVFTTLEVMKSTKTISNKIESLDAENKAFTTNLNSSINKIGNIIDISQSSDISLIDKIIKNYTSLIEKGLNEEKDKILQKCIDELFSLKVNLCTPTLEEPDFYRWLYNVFDNAGNNTKIKIVSMDNELEWTNTPQEAEFLNKNLTAAKKGVTITRIFAFEPTRLRKAKNNQAIYSHRKDSGTGLIGRYVDRNEFKNIAPTAFSNAGEGFILIDNTLVIVDVFSTDGKARGYVSFNQKDIRKYQETYDRFYSLSRDLVFN